MTDRTALSAQYRVAATVCAGFTLVPLLLTFVAWLIGGSAPAATAGSDAVDPLVIAIFGALALTPIVSVPIVRRMGREAARSPRVTAATLGSTLLVWKVTEFALWEITSLVGFVGFVLGAGWTFLIPCVGLCLVGYAFSFPRWSEWEERADEFDSAQMSAGASPGPLGESN